jgi:hypothetical protein
MARLCEVLVDLIDAPYVVLMVLLVLRVDCVQFADRARRCKQGRMEKPGEALKSTSQGRRCDVEVIIGICSRRERVGGTVISGKELRELSEGPENLATTCLGVFILLRKLLSSLLSNDVLRVDDSTLEW